MDVPSTLFSAARDKVDTALISLGYGTSELDCVGGVHWASPVAETEYGATFPSISLLPSDKPHNVGGCQIVADYPTGGRFEQNISDETPSSTVEHALAVLGLA